MKTPDVVKLIVGNQVEPKWNATTMSFEYANNTIKTVHALVNTISKQAQFRDYGKITNNQIIVRFQQQPPDFQYLIYKDAKFEKIDERGKYSYRLQEVM